MRLFGTVDGRIDRRDRAGWLSCPFDLAWSGAIAPAPTTGVHPDAGRSTGVRLGPDPSRSQGRRLGVDPSRSTGSVT